MDTTISNVSAI